VERLRVIEQNLLPLVLATLVLGLLVPSLGVALEWAITPLLALLMFLVSLSFNARAVRVVLARPQLQILALFLVYVPMSIAGFLLGRVFFGSSNLGIGQALVGALPTDVSAPLLVLLARGNVALAAVLNAINTALAPFIVPAIFLFLTGVELDVPVGQLMLELFLVIVLPMTFAVWLRTRYPDTVTRFGVLSSSGSSIVYLLLLLAVVGPNAATIMDYGWYAAVIALAAVSLNLLGYAFGSLARLVTTDPQERIAFLFTVSKKEFSIAAFIVVNSGLPSEIVIPAVFFAVIQMITSPIAVRILNRRSDGQ
jgi:bile acid:Na+ symporter, BASS family